MQRAKKGYIFKAHQNLIHESFLKWIWFKRKENINSSDSDQFHGVNSGGFKHYKLK